jgi:hypothetical protein
MTFAITLLSTLQYPFCGRTGKDLYASSSPRHFAMASSSTISQVGGVHDASQSCNVDSSVAIVVCLPGEDYDQQRKKKTRGIVDTQIRRLHASFFSFAHSSSPLKTRKKKKRLRVFPLSKAVEEGTGFVLLAKRHSRTKKMASNVYRKRDEASALNQKLRKELIDAHVPVNEKIHTPVSTKDLFTLNTGETLESLRESINPKLQLYYSFRHPENYEYNLPLVVTTEFQNEKQPRTWWGVGPFGYTRDIPFLTLKRKKHDDVWYVYPKLVYNQEKMMLEEPHPENICRPSTDDDVVLTLNIRSIREKLPLFIATGDVSGTDMMEYFKDELCDNTLNFSELTAQKRGQYLAIKQDAVNVEEMATAPLSGEECSNSLNIAFQRLRSTVNEDLELFERVINQRIAENYVQNLNKRPNADTDMKKLFTTIGDLQRKWNANSTLWDDPALYKLMSFVNKMMEAITSPEKLAAVWERTEDDTLAQWLKESLQVFPHLVVNTMSLEKYLQWNVHGVSSRKVSTRVDARRPWKLSQFLSKCQSIKSVTCFPPAGKTNVLYHMYAQWTYGDTVGQFTKSMFDGIEFLFRWENRPDSTQIKKTTNLRTSEGEDKTGSSIIPKVSLFGKKITKWLVLSAGGGRCYVIPAQVQDRRPSSRTEDILEEDKLRSHLQRNEFVFEDILSISDDFDQIVYPGRGRSTSRENNFDSLNLGGRERPRLRSRSKSPYRRVSFNKNHK